MRLILLEMVQALQEQVHLVDLVQVVHGVQVNFKLFKIESTEEDDIFLMKIFQFLDDASRPRAKRKCGLCGQEGHIRTKCPNNNN